jgi:hypothetical protein
MVNGYAQTSEKIALSKLLGQLIVDYGHDYGQSRNAPP